MAPTTRLLIEIARTYRFVLLAIGWFLFIFLVNMIIAVIVAAIFSSRLELPLDTAEHDRAFKAGFLWTIYALLAWIAAYWAGEQGATAGQVGLVVAAAAIAVLPIHWAELGGLRVGRDVETEPAGPKPAWPWRIRRPYGRMGPAGASSVAKPPEDGAS